MLRTMGRGLKKTPQKTTPHHQIFSHMMKDLTLWKSAYQVL